MPLLRVSYKPREGRGGRGRACEWMEEVKGDGEEGEPAERKQQSSSDQTPAVCRPWQTFLLRTLRPQKGWCSFALVGLAWSACRAEMPLHPSLLLVDVCWRLLSVCVLWMLLGVGAHALKCCLRPGRHQGEPPPRVQQEIGPENRNNQFSRLSESWTPGRDPPLALALADSLLLCVLQEPLPDPSVAHVKALLCRLQSVFCTLQKADIESEAHRDSALIDKVKLTHTYLQQRTRSLCGLVQVQGDFEASVRDMLEGLDGLWARLEELHTGVTLTKEGSRDHGDLASARADAENLFAVLGHYRSRLQCCQAHLKNSTQLLQELTWSHSHISGRVSCSAEAVWPELLLQSNIEQFDKVQESFFSVEQQTSTFQAHLEGLGKGDQGGLTGPLAQTNGASPQASRSNDASPEHRGSTAASTSVSSADADTDSDTDARLSLCERSALQVSSTIGRLRQSGRRK